ncbi:MAG: efflux RND transporter permease subunit, partial [Patescibacteria group bacterium]
MKHASYLKHLKFNPSLRNSLQAKYLRNPRLLVLLLLLITTFGAYSYVNLPRRLNPEIKIPYVVVSDVLPGASASDVESLITDPLEDAVGGLQNIDTFVSTSRDSISVVQIQFKTGTDADKAASDVKTAVDAVSLQADAQKVNVIKVDFEKFPVWTFSIKSKSGDIASLLAFSKELKDSLESVSTIDEVNVTGLEEQEIQILIKPETMSTYNFNPQTLLSQLSSANKSFPAGTVTTDNSNFTLSINPAASSINDIRSTKINLNGTVVDLSDIATVSERSKPAQSQSYVAKVGEKPEQSITFSIFKTSNADISKTVKDAKKVTDSLVSKYGDE